ncbi:MarR family transcriptional regulator [Mycolicibacterium celeriflavum]|uniref:MarR family winged helix-turn-helix transcriptional regulator n=1 Tax=Mycolicibacterium celeriflavum TaxID=1249101 RepID=UPI0007FD8BFA|nr:MarR family transcriptional regulator [Mycolicibacterium celeriflavum]OBG13282.1 MarR family transcriptional regulator [Mycolicibacterium celeriflavum]
MVDMDRPLAEQPLGFLLSRVANALRAEVTTTVLEPLDVAFPQYLCMRILSQHPGRSNAELARDFNVSPQAMNMVLRGLQDRGLVSRPASVPSGRSLPAQLTREGRELLKRTDSGVRAAEGKLMANLTQRQQREFKQILAALGTD